MKFESSHKSQALIDNSREYRSVQVSRNVCSSLLTENPKTEMQLRISAAV